MTSSLFLTFHFAFISSFWLLLQLKDQADTYRPKWSLEETSAKIAQPSSTFSHANCCLLIDDSEISACPYTLQNDFLSMINSRGYLRPINSLSRRTRTPLCTVLTPYSCRAYQQVPSFAARPRLACHKTTRTEFWSNKIEQNVSTRNSTSVGFSCYSTSKMDLTPPTTAGDTSSTAAGLPLTDEHIATHIPATLEDYSFPIDKLRTLNDTTKTPLVLMACGSCQSYVSVQPRACLVVRELTLTAVVSPITFLHLRFVVISIFYNP